MNKARQEEIMPTTGEKLTDHAEEIAHRDGNKGRERVRKGAGIAEKIENGANEPNQIICNQSLDP